MKLKLGFALLLLFAIASIPGRAQGDGQRESLKQEEKADASETIWLKWVNTGIFAVLLGWGIAKSAPAFFNARSADIQKAIQEATGLKIDADFRYSAIDRKLATLGDEVKRMRADWERALEHEHQQILADTQDERRRIQHHVDAEVAGLEADSAFRLRQRTAGAALAQAERRLAETGGAQDDALVNDLVGLVEGSAA